MRPTSRGWRLIAVAMITSIFSAIFLDFLLVIASAIIVIILLLALIDYLMRIRRIKEIGIEPRELNIKARAGERGELLFKIYTSIPFMIDDETNWLTCNSKNVLPPRSILKFTIGSGRSGIYRKSDLKICLTDFLNLFKTHVRIPLKVEAKIYPRVFPLIMEALRLIEGRASFGETPGKWRGHGLEYLWSREYQLGDSLKLVDWKATARLQKIMVKEFLEDAYGSIKIIHDVRAHGPVSRDECSSYLLSAIISSIIAGLPLSITMKNGDKIIFDLKDVSSAEILRIVIGYIVESHISREWRIYELFEPKSARMLLSTLKEFKSRTLQEAVKLRLETVKKELHDLMKVGKPCIIYTGCILIDSDFVKELADMAGMIGAKLIILTPSKPWVDVESLEEAYLAYQSYNKLLRALEKMNVEVKFGKSLKQLSK